MRYFRADQYVGKRVRCSASVKSEGIQNLAGLWMRVGRRTFSVMNGGFHVGFAEDMLTPWPSLFPCCAG